MLIVLSPAKTLDFDSPVKTPNHTLPEFQDRAADLVGVLRKYSPARLSGLMDISDQLATLNAGRFAAWSRQPDRKETRQAIFAFNGDVYEGLDASSLTIRQLDYAQSHIRILSGLYGVLRPLDLMQPYRLEMGAALANPAGRNLYAFWGTTVTGALNAVLVEGKHKALINLASEEYFKSVKPALLDCPVITPVFEDWKGGRYKVISFHAKRARGLMARYAAIKRIADPEKLKKFDLDGYAFDARASGAASWVFRRRLEN